MGPGLYPRDESIRVRGRAAPRRSGNGQPVYCASMGASFAPGTETAVVPGDGSDRVTARGSGGVCTRRWAFTGWRLYALVVAAFAIPFVVALGVLAHPTWYPTLDLAHTEMRVRDVWSNHPPLIGLPGRIGTLSQQGSHPGPLSFWALSPFYELFGGSSWALQAATTVLNLGAVALTLWMARRRGGSVLMLAMAAVLAVLVGFYGPYILTEPWNPYLPVLWWVVFVAAVWSVLDEDLAMLPFVVLAGSFCTQTHISYVGLVAGLGVLALAGAGWSVWSRRTDPAVRPDALRWGLVSVGLGAVLWALPVYQQLTGEQPNLSLIYEHFRNPPESPVGLGTGVRLFFVHLDPWKLLTGHDTMTGSLVPGIGFLTVWGLSALGAWRSRIRALVRLDVVIGASLLLGLVSMSRIFGFLWYYLVLWSWGVTALMVLAIGWTIAVLAVRRESPDQRARTDRVGRAVLASLTVVALASFTIDAATVDVPDARISRALGTLAPAMVHALGTPGVPGGGREGRYLVTWVDPVSIGSPGFGLLDELDRHGFRVGLPPAYHASSPGNRIYGPSQLTGVVHLAIGRSDIDVWRAKPGVREVAAVDLRSAPQRAEYRRLRRRVISMLRRAGLSDLARSVDDNLFMTRFQPQTPSRTYAALERMLSIGQPSAVFVGPASAAGP